MQRDSDRGITAGIISNEALRAVIDAIPQRVFWKDVGLVYLGCNREFARDMGYSSPEEVVGRTDFQASWAEVAESYRADDRRVIDTGIPKLNYEEEQRTADGRVVWLRTSKVPLYGPDGQSVGVLGMYEDVTERRRAAESLRESEARFRTLVQALPDAVLICTGERVAFCNPAGLRLLGAAGPAEVIGRSPFDLHPPVYHEAIRKRAAVTRATGTPVPPVEEEVLRLDGQTVPVLVTALPIHDGGSAAVLVVIRDLTEQKRVERQMRYQDLLLREAAELAHVGGWSFDPVTLEADWTPAVAIIHDLPPDAPAGVGRGIDYYEGEDRERIAAAVAAAIRDGTPYDLELRLVSATGAKKWVRSICRPLIEGGRVVRIRGSLQDITERKRLEEQLWQSQKMEAVGQLAGGIAHDFNNLLTVMGGYANLILSRLSPADSQTREPMTEILDASRRAAGLTRQLLAFSRRQVVAPQVLDLNAVVVGSEKLLRRLIGEDFLLAFAPGAGLWPVVADPGMMEQVLMNLCVNARDAMPTGGRLTIETRNVELDEGYTADHPDARPGPHVLLAVSDTGTGIAPDVLARVFEPFFTTKGPGKGTGLGLATVHSIVKQSGGHLGVYSEAGVGTTFKVYLPRSSRPAEPSGSQKVASPSRGNETVLLVEDDGAVRALIRRVLSMAGHVVLEAASAAEAERVAAASAAEAERAAAACVEPIHLLLTDVVMPDGGGRTVADSVAGLHPAVRVLYMSGYTDDAVVRHGVLREGVHFLQKPFTPIQLVAKVREVLDSTDRLRG